MNYYVQIGSSYYSYSGMDLSTVETLASNINPSYTMIDQATYDAAIAVASERF